MSENQASTTTGGSAPAGGGTVAVVTTTVVDVPNYDGDIAAMNAQVSYIDQTVLPHLEMLAAQAKRAGNGEAVLASIASAQESVNTARSSAATAVAAVRAANEAVRRAYADAADQAAKEKSYLQAE
ncbi:hypothetical protein ACQEU5_07140 [Marinactinospora thermotolerans]|uniref:hypothetical protein n=1 Tax=Marinactinospora thermotolerans TaxID=531310 RepID=UPI003D941865